MSARRAIPPSDAACLRCADWQCAPHGAPSAALYFGQGERQWYATIYASGRWTVTRYAPGAECLVAEGLHAQVCMAAHFVHGIRWFLRTGRGLPADCVPFMVGEVAA